VDVEAVLAGALPRGAYQLRLEPGGGTSLDEVAVDVRLDGRDVTYRGRPATGMIVQ
jgi:hypothetical protein